MNAEGAGRSALREAHTAGRAAWPNVDVTFERFVAMATKADAVSRVEHWPADFYLACGAGAGDAHALEIVERDCLLASVPRLRRLGATPDDVQDALQATRERLFVGADPRIRCYAASAPLKQWVQVVVMRTAIDLRRERRADREIVGMPVAKEPAAPTNDPSVCLLKATYRHEFETALGSEIAKLPTRDRSILKLHLLEGVSVEKIATMRAVHRVTVARWIWHASEAMLDGVRDYFLTRHGLIPEECDSLVNLVRSQLTLDWARLFEGHEA